MNCNNDIQKKDIALINSMDSSITTYVDHLSPAQLKLFPNSASYSPGKLLTFYYHILDRIDNEVPNTSFLSTLTINIEIYSFSSPFKFKTVDYVQYVLKEY